MANFTGPDPNRMLPGEPWTSDLALASFEDPIAIAEGAAGAPRVLPAALDGFYIGVISGTDSFVGLTSIDSNRLVRVDFSALIYSSTANEGIEARLTNDGGASWTADQEISAAVQSGTDERGSLHGTMFLDMSTGNYQSGSVSDRRLSPFLDNLTQNGSFAGSNFNGIQLRMTRSGRRFQASLTYMGVPHGL